MDSSTITSTYKQIDDSSSDPYSISGTFAIYPTAVDVNIKKPKQIVPRLKQAKTKEQLKAWGLRK